MKQYYYFDITFYLLVIYMSFSPFRCFLLQLFDCFPYHLDIENISNLAINDRIIEREM